jgi:ParB family chromosome partitioning protein
MPTNKQSKNSTHPKSIDINAVTIGDRRQVDPENVKDLVASISVFGHYSPIMVDNNLKLIAGRHRLEALKELQHQTVFAYVLDVSEAEAKLLELDENLCRSELNTAERIAAITERKQVYEQLHPSTKHGGDRSGQKDSSGKDCHLPSYADDTAAKTGDSARKIRQHATIGKHISIDRLRRLAQTPVGTKQVELQKFSNLQEPDQETVLAALEDGKVKTVRQAILTQANSWSDEMLEIVFGKSMLDAVRGFTVVDLRLLAAESTHDQHEVLALVADGLSVAEAIGQLKTEADKDDCDTSSLPDNQDEQTPEIQTSEPPIYTTSVYEESGAKTAIDAFQKLLNTDVRLIRDHFDHCVFNGEGQETLRKLKLLVPLINDAIDVQEGLLETNLQVA